MPTTLDVVFAVLFAVVIAGIEAAYFDKRFKAAVAAGVPDARFKAYRRAIVGQWVIAAIAMLLWMDRSRPWSQLWLTRPNGWRLGVSIAVVGLIAGFTGAQLFAIRRLSAAGAAKLRGKTRDVEFLLPHTGFEYRVFLVLSITAGVCEEILYRGFLTWLIAAYVGLPAGIGIAVVAFGCAHAYQGPKGIVKTGLVGLVMSLIVLASGWLIPAMIAHACVDIAGGTFGYKVLGGSDPVPVVDAA
jgi:membrane protease YdiL (CAAX protease family)